jgi:hypothetical protein
MAATAQERFPVPNCVAAPFRPSSLFYFISTTNGERDLGHSHEQIEIHLKAVRLAKLDYFCPDRVMAMATRFGLRSKIKLIVCYS